MSDKAMAGRRGAGMKRRRWPLFLIGLGMFAAIWSGWVRLGQACGFGPVNLLPGIGHGLRFNAAITLPISVEAYGAYALGVWLSDAEIPQKAKAFARSSAIGALALGMVGQVCSHLIAAYHVTRPPWPAVVVVSCVPVVAFGLAVALTHLLRETPIISIHETPGLFYAPPARAAAETPDGTRPAVRQRPKRDTKRDKVTRLIEADPAVSSGALAKAAGVPRSTAARWKAETVQAGDMVTAGTNGKAH